MLILSFLQVSYTSDKPPPGYVFVPKGDVYMTRNWYESLGNAWNFLLIPSSRYLTNMSGRTLFIVYVR